MVIERGQNKPQSLISSPTWPNGARNAFRDVLSKTGLNYFLFSSMPQVIVDVVIGKVGKVRTCLSTPPPPTLRFCQFSQSWQLFDFRSALECATCRWLTAPPCYESFSRQSGASSRKRWTSMMQCRFVPTTHTQGDQHMHHRHTRKEPHTNGTVTSAGLL